MDSNTVIAVCSILSVMIAFITLVVTILLKRD